MARITGTTNESVYTIPKWLGLNEHPDGDTRLKLGEASEMVNWRITRDGNLKRRPGLKHILDMGASSIGSYTITGMWSGVVGGSDHLLVAVYAGGTSGVLYEVTNPTGNNPGKTQISTSGEFNASKGVSFLPFDNKLYILNGYEYYQWSGSGSISVVDGYRPLVAIAISPLLDGIGAESGETTGEYVNRLNGKRRVWISPDGENNIFQLPEKETTQIALTNVRAYQRSPWSEIQNISVTPASGAVTFNDVPTKGVNTIEIQYEMVDKSGYTNLAVMRQQVTYNRFAELFSGTQDTRIFLYGDGTNRALYSGMDYDGMPRADYFPDSYEVRVGDSTKITAMIRHYSSLITYKENECWSLQHGIVELATNELTPAVYSQPVNREIGNVAPGQVRLVNNNPITLHHQELYDWSNSSYYTSNLSRDERQAKRISDRIQKSIREFDLKAAHTWDDNDAQEYYIMDDGVALVWNYAVNAWYKYENFPAVCMCNHQGDLYVGTSDGKLAVLTDEQKTDNGTVIQAYWKSGAMDFGSAYARKYCSMLWIGLKPIMGAKTDPGLETSAVVSVLTDRKNTFREKIALSNKARVDGEPFTVKIKLKAKKFVFYHLLLSVEDEEYPVTITNVDFRVRQTGYAK